MFENAPRGVLRGRDVADAKVDLNIAYKKPASTPGVFLCTSRLVRREGKKIYLGATVEDGSSGTVLAVGDAMFVQVKSKL